MEWVNLALRWIHVITGVAWIGTSFYFNWLEGNLDRKGEKPKGVAGDLWAIHGGGFYHVTKYAVAPDQLPGTAIIRAFEASKTPSSCAPCTQTSAVEKVSSQTDTLSRISPRANSTTAARSAGPANLLVFARRGK